jgi:hypothetical protein
MIIIIRHYKDTIFKVYLYICKNQHDYKSKKFINLKKIKSIVKL